MNILFLIFFIFMHSLCFGMENPDVNTASAKSDSSSLSLSAQSWASFEVLPRPAEPLSFGDLPPRPSIEGNSISLPTLPFRHLTIAEEGESLRSSKSGNLVISGDEEEVFFLEHTQEAQKGTLSPDKLYTACYSQKPEGSWVEISYPKENKQIYSQPIPLGEFVDMRWRNQQLIIATCCAKMYVLTLIPQPLKAMVTVLEKSISKTGKKLKAMAIVNDDCWVLLKKQLKDAYVCKVDTNTIEKSTYCKLKKSSEENSFFLNSPKERVDMYSIASPYFLWRLSLHEKKGKRIQPWLKFPDEIYAYITATRKPIEVICCAQSNQTFSCWDVENKSPIKEIPPFSIKDLGKATKMSMHNQVLYISDEKKMADYPIVQLLRAANPRMSYM